MDRFNNCFVNEVQWNLTQNNLAFKALLILYNVPGHYETVRLPHPNIEVLLLPPNTTSLIQSLDKVFVATFKTYYIQRTSSYVFDTTENNDSLNVSVGNFSP